MTKTLKSIGLPEETWLKLVEIKSKTGISFQKIIETALNDSPKIEAIINIQNEKPPAKN